MCKNRKCIDCLLCEECCMSIDEITQKHIDVVQQWSDEHPIKTRQSKFLKMFPDARIDNGIIDICPKEVDETFKNSKCDFTICDECCKQFWSEEI